jgi:hypothetical protein
LSKLLKLTAPLWGTVNSGSGAEGNCHLDFACPCAELVAAGMVKPLWNSSGGGGKADPIRA